MFFTDVINKIIMKDAKKGMTEKEFFERQISDFKNSHDRRMMFDGTRYYKGDHDILFRKRTAIGDDGKLQELTNLPNNRTVYNQYRKLVMQKVNYLCGKPVSLQGDNEAYVKVLNDVLFTKAFQKKLNIICKNALNEGTCYLLVHYNEFGELKFKVIPAHEFVAGWADAEHTELQYGIRVYLVEEYDDEYRKIVEYAEVYTENGVDYYKLNGGTLIPVEPYHEDYFMKGEVGLNWTKIPIVAFKYNEEETPLIKSTKSLQDGINSILSNFENGMEEDTRNTILVLVNYDGQDLGQFRRNLATYGAVKVRSSDGVQGDVKTLQVEVNSENYKAILEIFKKAMIECAMGYDAKDDRMAGNPNQMNIQSMYSDIDLDANGIETQFQSSFEQLLWFVNCHLYNSGYGNFEGEEVTVIFDRDILINEGEVIDNIVKSRGILSDETLIAQHPWVTDPQLELERVEEQQQKKMEQYDMFPNNPQGEETEEDE